VLLYIKENSHNPSRAALTLWLTLASMVSGLKGYLKEKDIFLTANT